MREYVGLQTGILLRRLACPTLVLVGDGDFLWSPSSLEEAARLIPRCSTHVIPRAGHLPYFEASDEFQSVCGDFIARCELESAPVETAHPIPERGGER